MTTTAGPAQLPARVSICIGCGSTAKGAGECGSLWLAQADGLGVCDRCARALPAWEAGSRMAGWVPPAAMTTQRLLVRLGGRLVEPFSECHPLWSVGNFYVVNPKARTVFVVDQDGLPAVPTRGASRFSVGQGRFPLHVEQAIKRQQRAAKKRSRRRRA